MCIGGFLYPQIGCFKARMCIGRLLYTQIGFFNACMNIGRYELAFWESYISRTFAIGLNRLLNTYIKR